MGIVYLMLVLVSLTAGPALVAALAWSWWGVPIGVLSGVLAWWYFGRLAADGSIAGVRSCSRCSGTADP